jgi:hypothetical protein
MTPDHIQMIGFGLLVLAVGYFASLWLLKPVESEAPQTPAAQTSYGAQSPNFGLIQGGTFNFNHTPPLPEPSQPKPPPELTGERSHRATKRGQLPDYTFAEAGEILPAGMPISTLWMEPIPAYKYDIQKLNEGLGRVLGVDDSLKPDCPLEAVLVRLYKSLGPIPRRDQDKERFCEKVDLALIDGIVLNSMHVWGRAGLKAISPILFGHLKDGQIYHRNKTFHVIPQGHSMPLVYSDLKFNQAEVDRVWPAKDAR